MKTQPTSDEKFWAVLSHVSALASGVGMVLPAFAWVDNRKKSNYAAFQSLQALGYQSLGYTLFTVVYLVLVTLMIIVLWLLAAAKLQSKPVLDIWLMVCGAITVLVFGLYLLLPIIATVMCALGRDYRYPILGDRLARYMGYDPAAEGEAPLNELHEERFAVSMGHFCVIYPLSGLLVPIGFWASQNGRSPYMKFQSLQTIVFQTLGSLATCALGALAFIIAIIAMLPFITHPSADFLSMESIIPAFIFLICIFIIVLIVPLYQILGQWAGLRILQGREYRYPVIGRWVERWLAKREIRS
jgi:uncharacterized Tic20 family protein